MTSRELVKSTLEFTNRTQRVPRHLWQLPWAEDRFPAELERINRDYPSDIVTCSGVVYEKTAPTVGDAYAVGSYIDDWGCKFYNLHKGVIGEVKEAIVPASDEEWDDISGVHIPTEWLTFDIDSVNAFCRSTDKFVMCGCCPRPFEQMQFIRGTEQLYIDLMLKPERMIKFLGEMHAFYCELLEKWAKTEVDALNFMDDWGSQNTLLINPEVWVDIFKPMYRDYIDIAHRAGKKIFMHSDGNTLHILPHLIELGLDAMNSQIFCMGLDNVAQHKGKLTFWGEIDRQHLLPEASVGEIAAAVREARAKLWDNGGCIAQCEFGPGAKPENVYQVFETWNEERRG